jgi:GAF domain-containing protein
MTAESTGFADIQLLCQASVDLLDVTGMGISLITAEGYRARVGASNDLAAEIEELQFSLGEGPCFDAFEHDRPVMIADLAQPPTEVSGQWPIFADAASRAGVRAIIALPLRVGGRLFGAIDLVRDRPGLLTDSRLKLARAIAEVAAGSLVAQAGDEVLFVDGGTQLASYRLEVHQATGMVAVQLEISTEDALARIRARAFTEGRPISALAAEIVARQVRFNREDDS